MRRARTEPAGAPPSADVSKWGQRAVLVALAVVVSAVSPYFSRVMNANERPRLLQAVAWLEDGESAIDGPIARGIEPGVDISIAPDGRTYPNKPPGASVPAALAYAGLRGFSSQPVHLDALTHAARFIGSVLPAMWIIVLATRRWGRSRAVSFALVTLMLGTPMLAYARLLYGHALAAALLFAGVLQLERARQHRAYARAAAGGVLASLAVTVEYTAAFAAVPVALWLVRRPRVAAVGLLGALLPIAALACYHAAAFGSPWVTPYHFVADSGFASVHGRGLLGLHIPTAESLREHLLSPWGGLLYWAPMAVVAIGSSARAALRGERGLELLCVSIAGVFLLVLVGLEQTGGWRVGPRYFVLALPMLLPGWVRTAQRGRMWPVVVALLGASIFLQFLAAGLFPHLVSTGNPLRDVLLPLWAHGLRPHSYWEVFGLGSYALGISGLITLGLFVHVTAPPGAKTRAWLAGCVGAWVLVALAWAWPFAPQPSTMSSEDVYAALARIWEPGGPQPCRQQVIEPAAPKPR